MKNGPWCLDSCTNEEPILLLGRWLFLTYTDDNDAQVRSGQG